MSSLTFEKRKISGKILLPESKSDVHRALISAAISGNTTEIPLKKLNTDIAATAKCLSALGEKVDYKDGKFTLTGKLVGGGTLECNDSASTLRFLMPLAAVLGKETKFEGIRNLPLRPLSEITELMRKEGCEISGDFLPLTVKGRMTGNEFEITGKVSSQYVSGLMFALCMGRRKGKIVLTTELQSEKYADMTAKTLEKFGFIFEKYRNKANNIVYELKEIKNIKVDEYIPERDWSAGANFAVMAAMGGEITLENMNFQSLQPDKKIMEILENVGAEVKIKGNDLFVKEKEVKPFSVSVKDNPDIFPVLAVLACKAKGESKIYDAERLRFKETDRIKTTGELIKSLGGECEYGENYLKIYGKGKLKGGKCNSYGDHRIAMAAACASVICENKTEIENIECVNKSYPEFFEDFAKILV